MAHAAPGCEKKFKKELKKTSIEHFKTYINSYHSGEVPKALNVRGN